MTQLQSELNPVLDDPSLQSESQVPQYFDRLLDQMATDAPLRPVDLTGEQMAEFHTRFPNARDGKTEDEIRELAAWYYNNPHGTIGPPPEEQLATSIKLAPGRLVGGIQRGALVEPAAMISSGFGTLASAYGNDALADAFRQNAERIRRQDNATVLGRLSQDDSAVAKTGQLIGNVAPGGISLVASGGASGPVLLYYAMQAAGGGAEEYRDAMEAQGVDPDAIDELQFAVGYATVEVVTEKLGLDLIGGIGSKMAGRIGDAMLSGNKRVAAQAIADLAAGSSVNSVEEMLAQVGQNALASKGTFFAEGFDPQRGLLEGVPEAGRQGALGGGILTSAAVFSPAGRQRLRSASEILRGQPLTEQEIELAQEALQSFAPPLQVGDVVEGAPIEESQSFDLPHEYTTLDEQQQADVNEFVEALSSNGIDPETRRVLTQSERRRAMATKDALRQTIEQQESEPPIEEDAQEIQQVEEAVAEEQQPQPQQEPADEPPQQIEEAEEQPQQEGVERPTLTERLKTAEDAALQRLRSTRRPAAVQRDEQGRPIRGARGGSAPIFSDVANVTIALTARALRNGITTTAQIRSLVHDFVVMEAEHLQPHINRIIRNIRTIMSRSVVDDTLDEEVFEREITRIRAEAARRDRRNADTIKSRIREHVQGPAAAPTITESEALRQRLRGEQRAARAASIEERRRQDAIFRERIVGIRQRAQTTAQRLRGEVAEARSRTRQARLRAREVNQLKSELTNVVRELLPAELRGNLITDIRDVKTLESLARSTRKVLELRKEFMRKQEIENLESIVNGFDLNKLRPEFKSEMQRLIGDLSLTKMSESTERKLQGLRRFLEASSEVVVPARIEGQLQRLDRTPINKLSRDEARGLADAVEHILHLNKLKNRLIRNGRLTERSELLSEIAAEAEQNVNGNTAKVLTMDMVLKPDTLAEWWGGGEDSTSWQVLYNDLRIGQREWLHGHQQFTDKVQAIMARHGLDPSSQATARLSAVLSRHYGITQSMIRRDRSLVNQTRATIRTVRTDAGDELSLTPDEMMYITAMVKDRETYDFIVFNDVPIRIVRDENRTTHALTAADLARVESALSDAERGLVNDVVALMNTDLTEEVRGWSVDHLGYDITNDETWFPRHRDRTREIDAFSSANFAQGLITSASIVQSRTGGNAPIQVRSFFGEVHNTSWMTYAVGRMSEPVSNARTVLDSEQMKRALGKRGEPIRKHFISVLDEIAREAVGGPSMQGSVERIVARLVDNAQVGLLGANLPVMLYQPASLLVASSEIGERHIARAILSGAPVDGAIDDLMRRHSPVLRARFESAALSLLSEAGDSRRRRAILGISGEQAPIHAASEWLMGGIRYFDKLAIRTIWRSAEIEVREQRPSLAGDAYWQAVADRAEQVVLRTQPVFDTLHLSGIGLNARRKPFLRATTMFYSQRNQNINIAARNMIRARRTGSLADKARAAKNISYALVGGSLLVASIKSMFSLIDPDDDEDRGESFLRNLVGSTLSNIYFGDYIAFVVDRAAFGERGFEPQSPVTGLMNDIFSNGTSVINRALEGDARFWESLMRFARDLGTAAGIPIAAPYRIIEDIIKRLNEGDREDESL